MERTPINVTLPPIDATPEEIVQALFQRPPLKKQNQETGCPTNSRKIEIDLMSIYLVALNLPNKLAWETIQTSWPVHHFILTDHLAFVAPDEPALTATIAETIA